MYHKFRSTLAGLGMASSFAIAGLLFGAPLTPDPPPLAAQQQDARIDVTDEAADRIAVLAMARIALAVLEAQAAADAAESIADAAPPLPVTTDQDAHPVVRKTSKLLQLQMPYYSFGALLTRRGES